MKSIYLDNYRGFREACVSIEDVNFCVGENSSGKTSFLSAVNLLTSGKFWFEQSFGVSEGSFGHYDDFVSIAAKDKSYFRLGVADTEAAGAKDNLESAQSQTPGRAFLFTFMDHEGVPRLRSFTTNYKNSAITVYYSENAVRYRVTPLTFTESPRVHALLFRAWSAIHDDRSLAGTKILKDDAITKGYMPLLYAAVLAISEAFTTVNKEGKKVRAGIPFPGPLFGGDAAWIAPIRTKPRRTYDEPSLEFSPEGAHVPYLLKKMLAGGRDSRKFVAFLRTFGRESGLFKQIKVHKFGKSQTSPFEIEIILDRAPLNLNSVGYGVAQGLPVIVEAFVRKPGSLFVIQQPEVHLHPRAQASVGEMIFNLADREGKRFIVETHSDFTVDRFRTSLRSAKKTSVNAQVLFFERVNAQNRATAIAIGSDGELSENQPAAYRRFFLKEGLKVIGF